MAERAETDPNATLGSLFTNLYERTEGLITDIKEERLQDLGLHWPRAEAGDSGRKARRTTTIIYVGEYALVSRTRSRTSQAAPMPEAVAAYRNREKVPDYVMARSRKGVITCRLGQLGVRGRARGEPAGETKGAIDKRLSMLDSDNANRVELVAASIADRLDIVEQVAYGEIDADQALARLNI